jgi:hypothetical protein
MGNLEAMKTGCNALIEFWLVQFPVERYLELRLGVLIDQNLLYSATCIYFYANPLRRIEEHLPQYPS